MSFKFLGTNERPISRFDLFFFFSPLILLIFLNRWYLTSDANVKLTTLCKAMDSLAYMLFYEKCSSEVFPGSDDSNK